MNTAKLKNIIPYILLYYGIAFFLRYYLVVVRPDFYTGLNEQLQGLLSGISPLIAGLVLVGIFHRPNDLSIFSVGYGRTFVAVLLPAVLFLIVGWMNDGHLNFSILVTVFLAILYAIFEEYGWRGYLQSELVVFRPMYKYLIVSVFWYFWHLDYGMDAQHLLSYFYVLAGSIGIGVVGDKSKSLILVALFHMYFNVFFSNSLEGISMMQKAVVLAINIGVVIYLMRVYVREERDAIQ